MRSAPCVLTAEGRRRLEAELDRLRKESRPDLRERLRTATLVRWGKFLAPMCSLSLAEVRL